MSEINNDWQPPVLDEPILHRRPPPPIDPPPFLPVMLACPPRNEAEPKEDK